MLSSTPYEPVEVLTTPRNLNQGSQANAGFKASRVLVLCCIVCWHSSGVRRMRQCLYIVWHTLQYYRYYYIFSHRIHSLRRNMFRSDPPKENLSSYGGTMSAPPPGGKKHRLSRFLTGDSQGYSESPNRPGPVPQPDSTYGSSDNAYNDIIQVENDGSIPNTNRAQNLALDRGDRRSIRRGHR